MRGRRVEIDAGAAMIEMHAHIRITLRGLDRGRVQRAAADGVDALVRVAVVGREMQLAGSVVDHPAAHRDGVAHDFLGDAELLERMNSAGGEREIDRATADEIAGVRIGAALVKIDLVAAPAEERGHHPAGETAADEGKLRHRVRISEFSERRKAGKRALRWHRDCYSRRRMHFHTTADKDGKPINRLELKSILLVDDDKQLASALQWILADENFLVDVAYDGEEAMQKFTAGEYDAVVCDLMMPRLRGDEFYLQARRDAPEHGEPVHLHHRLRGRPGDRRIPHGSTTSNYLVKPFPVEALIQRVKELLVSRRAPVGRRPADTRLQCRASEQLREPPHFVEGVVERRRRDADDVRLAEIAFHAGRFELRE